MKKMLCFILNVILMLSLVACGTAPFDENEPSISAPVSTVEPSANTVPDDLSAPDIVSDESNVGDHESDGILIAYFSRVGNTAFADDTDTDSNASIVATENGLQGNTEVVARRIQEIVGGELFLIQTEGTYPTSYDETIDVGQTEQGTNARPVLAAQVDNMDNYQTVFLGFPNWWGDMPMAVYSFLEEYDLSGKTIIPFVTSGGSGFSNTESALAELEPEATILEGVSIRDNNIDKATESVTTWLSKIGMTN